MYFASLKYPTSFLAPLPGNSCCSNFELSWSSYLFFFKIKKNSYLFLLSLPLPWSMPPSSSSYLFCFLYLYLHPRYPWKVILVHTFRPFWGESLEPSSLDLVSYPATWLIPHRASSGKLLLKVNLWESLSSPGKGGECFEQRRISISRIRAFISSMPKILLKGTSPEQQESWGKSASCKSYPPDSFMVHSS